MFPMNFSRRRLSIIALALAGGTGMGGWGLAGLWRWGQESRRKSTLRMRVTGGSMAPTLWGQHFSIDCPHCDAHFEIDASGTSSLVQSHRPTFPCWHCGGELSRPTGDARPGQVIDVMPVTTTTDIEHYPLVVVQTHGAMHVKRILGRPGDTVSILPQTNMPPRLCIHHALAPSPATMIAVDIDALRDRSRWSGDTIDWKRVNRKWYTVATPAPSAPLIYTHRSVHDFDQISAILDDCPANPMLARRLYPVTRVSLALDLTCDHPIELRSSLGATKFQPGRHATEFRGTATELSLVVLSSDATANVTIENLCIRRSIEYRLVPRDDQSRYPITLHHTALRDMPLAANEYFVVGDNVPISVDSRLWGPIRRDQIVGVVTGPAVR